MPTDRRDRAPLSHLDTVRRSKLRPNRLALAAAALALAGFTAAPLDEARAGDASVDATYGATFAGFPVGTGNLSFALGQSGEYTATIGASVTGLASLISNRSASASASGRAAWGAVSPKSYSLDISGGPVPNHVSMALAHNAVTSLDATEIRLPGWDNRIPVTAQHKRGVVDPLGAFVVSMPRGRDPLSPEVCNRTLKVFDGRARYDLRLVYGARTEVKGEAGSYSGPAIICAVGYRPIAGFRQLSAEELRAERNIEFSIVFVPVGTTGVLLPHKLVIGTPSGTLVVTAHRFEVRGATTRTAEAPEMTASTRAR